MAFLVNPEYYGPLSRFAACRQLGKSWENGLTPTIFECMLSHMPGNIINTRVSNDTLTGIL